MRLIRALRRARLCSPELAPASVRRVSVEASVAREREMLPLHSCKELLSRDGPLKPDSEKRRLFVITGGGAAVED